MNTDLLLYLSGVITSSALDCLISVRQMVMKVESLIDISLPYYLILFRLFSFITRHS